MEDYLRHWHQFVISQNPESVWDPYHNIREVSPLPHRHRSARTLREQLCKRRVKKDSTSYLPSLLAPLKSPKIFPSAMLIDNDYTAARLRYFLMHKRSTSKTIRFDSGDVCPAPSRKFRTPLIARQLRIISTSTSPRLASVGTSLPVTRNECLLRSLRFSLADTTTMAKQTK
jgi:hypothetical protein